MKKIFHRLKFLFPIIMLMLMLGTSMLVSPVSAADPKNAVCEGADLTGTGTGTSCSAGNSDIQGIIEWVVNILSVIVGVTAVIMIIVGGFRYVTSGGDSNSTASAKNTIIYAIVGLVVVALAQFIVKFVLNKATSSTP